MQFVTSSAPTPRILGRHMRLMRMATSAVGAAGRIWIYRCQDMPRKPFPSSLSLLQEASTTLECPLPKRTPSSPPGSKLYNMQASQSLQDYLLKVHNIKADFYRNEFNRRVSKKDSESCIQKRRIKSHRSREVGVTIYFPQERSTCNNNEHSKLQGICLHVHGGGWLWGDSCHQVAHRCLEMAQHLNAAVVSVEYSLLSQHNASFDPVADTIAALEWIEECGARELNSHQRLVASGESSGAHLLLLAILHRRDDEEQNTKLQSNWRALNLVYGVYDLSGTPSICNDGDASSPLSGNELLWMYHLYCARIKHASSEALDRKDPSLSPLHADLSSLPPALITVGTRDPLLDDSLFLAEKYNLHGNHVEVALYQDGEHGIGHFGLQENEVMGDQARYFSLDFMKGHLAQL